MNDSNSVCFSPVISYSVMFCCRQVTGIGAGGSFVLSEPFVPSPVVLAGRDNPSDYDSSGEEDEKFNRAGGDGEGGYAHGFSVEMFQDNYVPRPSKRHARAASRGVKQENLSAIAHAGSRFRQAAPRPAPRRNKRKVDSRRKVKQEPQQESSSEEEESEEEEEVAPPPPKKKPTPAKKKPAKSKAPAKSGKAGKAQRSQSPRKASQPSYREEESDEEEEEAPRPVQKSSVKSKPRQAPASTPKQSPRKASRPSYREEESDEEEEEEAPRPVQKSPVKSKPRQAPASTPKRKAASTSSQQSRGSPRKNYAEDSDDDDDDEARTQQRGGRARRSLGRSFQEQSGSEAESEEIPVIQKTPNRSRKTPKSGRKSRGGR